MRGLLAEVNIEGPVVTIANKSEFENNAEYRDRVANDVADLLFGILDGQFCDRDRIYVPR